MQGTIITLKVDGSQQVIKLDRAPTLDDIKAAIGGGYIEIVPCFNRFVYEGAIIECVAFCDEEGKIKNFFLNEQATYEWHKQIIDNDYLVGDIAVIFGDAEFMEAL